MREGMSAGTRAGMSNKLAVRRLLVATLLLCMQATAAAPAEFSLVIRGHLFFPATLEIPANQKVKLLIENQDATPEEFESYELNREKVIPGNSKTVIFIGPLPPGTYPFFGEFYPKTAQGKAVVK
jgi:hypothetical protein